jgi:hypothetical protein
MKTIFTASFIFLCSVIKAQEYNVLLIPDTLTKNANAVKRFEELHVIIKSVDKVIIKRKYAITILNELGDKYAVYSNYYNKSHDLNDISGALFDAFGKKVRSVKKKDIADVSLRDGFSLMRDDRIKTHNFYYRVYPYTVEYSDEQVFEGTYSFPGWTPVEDYNFSVQQSKYILEMSSDYQIRFKQFNYPGQPITTDGTTKTITWEIKNTKAYGREYLEPDFSEITTCVYTAPTDFSYGGYTGDMSSWLSFGKYQAELNIGRDELPSNIKDQVHKLTDGVSDPKEKIKILYQYLQNNTRYISIQLGIGGLQPFDAKYVGTNSYGDCKALSNYMHSLLKEVGINGYYTSVHGGEGEKFFMPDFPSHQSNHVILCVPLGKDTMWLECTDQKIPAGYLGNFTDDRYALMIKDDGGYLVRTPTYGVEDNLKITNINSSLDESGNLIASIKISYKGLEQDNIFSIINNYSKEKVLEFLKKGFNLPTYDIEAFNYTQQKDIIPIVEGNLKLVANNYASVSGKRLFITPNILSQNTAKPSIQDKRKYEIVYPYSFIHIDTVNIQIPSGYTIETMPKDVIINNKFGNYEIHFKTEDQKINCTRLYKRSEGRFPPSDYAELVKYYDDMYKADRSRIVFIKKEG